MDDLQLTLDNFSVPHPEQAEVKALVESTRAAIVSSPAAHPAGLADPAVIATV